jgi:hypothetical protein
MRRLLQWLVRLYPRSWRKQYESEFQLLIQDAGPSWTDLIDVSTGGLKMRLLRSNLAWILLFGLFGTLLAASALWAMPQRYESSATLSFFAPDRRLAKETEAVLTERALSHEALNDVITKFGLYKGESNEKAIESLRQAITISSAYSAHDGNRLGSAAVSISFRDSEPGMVPGVTRDLVARFIDENIRANSVATVELVNGATEPRPLTGPSPLLWIGLAFVESIQLGWLAALLRKRSFVTAVPAL